MTAEAPPCAKCGGTGKILVDETTHRMCICLYNRKMRVRLGTELMSAKPIFDGPLYQQVFDAEQGNLPTTDLTSKNLFIKTYWTDLLGHLTWAFYCKGPTYNFQIVTDERIRNVFVGNEQFKQKTYQKRQDEESNNSLHDLVGGDLFDLVIVRLGFLGYKNVAMAGALLEALRIREVQLKPTWVIEEPNSVLAPGHFSYSEEVLDYIRNRFETLDIALAKDDGAIEPRGFEGAVGGSDAGMSLEDERPAPAPFVMPKSSIQATRRPRFEDEKPAASTSTGDEAMDKLMGTGKPSYKSNKGKWKGNRGGDE